MLSFSLSPVSLVFLAIELFLLRELTNRFEGIVGLTNPSNLDLEVGDVTFQLFSGEDFIGTTVLPVCRASPIYSSLLRFD